MLNIKLLVSLLFVVSALHAETLIYVVNSADFPQEEIWVSGSVEAKENKKFTELGIARKSEMSLSYNETDLMKSTAFEKYYILRITPTEEELNILKKAEVDGTVRLISKINLIKTWRPDKGGYITEASVVSVSKYPDDFYGKKE